LIYGLKITNYFSFSSHVLQQEYKHDSAHIPFTRQIYKIQLIRKKKSVFVDVIPFKLRGFNPIP